MDEVQTVVEAAIERWLLPEGEDIPDPLRDAVRHVVFPGGKRLRPALAVMSCRACGGKDADVLPAAVALELIHCYSLVHDDLPAMDDDDLRRGRPTCHKVYGEAMAILAGDALLTRAFEVVANSSPPELVPGLVREIADAAGIAGMVGGQAGDLLGEGESPTEERVAWIHERKTAALIRAAVKVGALAARADDSLLSAADRFGLNLGLAFQIVDDLLGRSGQVEVTGKPVGKDDERGKLTYPAAIGMDRATQKARELTERAVAEAAAFPESGPLQTLAEVLRERVS